MKETHNIQKLEKGIRLIGELSSQENIGDFYFPELKGVMYFLNKIILFIKWLSCQIINPGVTLIFAAIAVFIFNNGEWYWYIFILLVWGLLEQFNYSAESQLGIEKIELKWDFFFYSLDISPWDSIRNLRTTLINGSTLLFNKNLHGFRVYNRENIIKNPRFDLSKTNNIYILSGLKLVDEIIPNKQIVFSERMIMKIQKENLLHSIFFILQSNNRESYPVILSTNPQGFKDGYNFFIFLIKKLESLFPDFEGAEEFIINGLEYRHSKDFQGSQEDYFQMLIEDGGIHIKV